MIVIDSLQCYSALMDVKETTHINILCWRSTQVHLRKGTTLRYKQRNVQFQVFRHLRTCLLTLVLLVLFDASQDKRYHLIGARSSLATTREVDVSSLITECTNIWPRYPPAK